VSPLVTSAVPDATEPPLCERLSGEAAR